MAKKKGRRRKPKTKLTPEQRKQKRENAQFKRDIRTMLTNSGFEFVPTRDQEFEVAGHRGELDGVYVYENVVVAVEETLTTKQSDVVDHLRKKAEFYRHLAKHRVEFITVLKSLFPRFEHHCREPREFSDDELKVFFLYCSRTQVEGDYRDRYRDACLFLQYPHLQYFLQLSKTIKRSARFEIFKFLGLNFEDIGFQSSATDSTGYQGLLLPHTPSGFPTGYKLVSFLMDPATLLERGYVLRADGWMDDQALYQRLLVRGKIAKMREYLTTEHRVFVNNIITTLPKTTNLLDPDTNKVIENIDPNRITPVGISIPRTFSAIGIVDGQHRVFAYHEGNDNSEKKISTLRGKQHLLVTGIIYPANQSQEKKQLFESKLFLEINDKQTRVKGQLKQDIERIVNPYSPVAIAKSVIAGLADNGPLSGQLEVHFYDRQKIKTTSIVSYGLVHIVKLDDKSAGSFFNGWNGSHKSALQKGEAPEALQAYVKYCTTELNKLLGAFRAALPDGMWTDDRKVSSVLTTTTINGLIFCMRCLLENNKLQDFDGYLKGFKKMQVNFAKSKFRFKSSHWKELGERLFKECFA